MDAIDGVRECVSAGRSGEDGSVGRALGLRNGTRRNVEVFRGEDGGLSVEATEVDGPATGCDDEDVPPFGSDGKITAAGAVGSDSFSSEPLTDGVGGFPGDGRCVGVCGDVMAVVGGGDMTEGTGDGV